jgi:hypothetical protein
MTYRICDPQDAIVKIDKIWTQKSRKCEKKQMLSLDRYNKNQDVQISNEKIIFSVRK